MWKRKWEGNAFNCATRSLNHSRCESPFIKSMLFENWPISWGVIVGLHATVHSITLSGIVHRHSESRSQRNFLNTKRIKLGAIINNAREWVRRNDWLIKPQFALGSIKQRVPRLSRERLCITLPNIEQFMRLWRHFAAKYFRIENQIYFVRMAVRRWRRCNTNSRKDTHDLPT